MGEYIQLNISILKIMNFKLIYLMTNSLDMTPREVRTAITTKCADENKMLRSRMQRKSK